jgi:uncharacterized protein (TIGR02231 family)
MLYLMNKNTPRPKARYRIAEGDYEQAAPPQSMDRMGAALSEVQVTSKRNITPAQFTEVQTTSTNAVFDINIPYSVKSDGKPSIVEIQNYEVTAEYNYFSSPKLDKDAFLIADLAGWNQSELLPGDANVYFENNFVGKTYFDSGVTDDTLSFALGRDNNIKINRKLIKDFKEKTGVSGNYIKHTKLFEIELKNTRKTEIRLKVEDQVPLSTNEELSIEKLEANDARYDKDTGKLTWEIVLKPGESKKLSMGYAVKYPKSMVIQGF